MGELNDTLKREMSRELTSILGYWSQHTLDKMYGGFHGRIDHYNRVIPHASKGVILNTRILWSFSQASIFFKTDQYASICERAYNYLLDHFWDYENGGLFWEVDYAGHPLNTRKQIYAQAFGIYAFCAYFQYTKETRVRDMAVKLFQLVEKYARDKDNGGYIEAFDRQWNTLDDVRLSPKDMNALKTMNTHLHLLEAYTDLLEVDESESARIALEELMRIHLEILFNDQHHFDLFFDQQWNLLSHTISFGHDIEAGWLILTAAKALNEASLIARAEQTLLQVADTFLSEAIDKSGGVNNEKDTASSKVDRDKHWWPQVEALVGLAHAYQLKKDQRYLRKSLDIWGFTKTHLLDHKHGEWHFRVDRNGRPYTNEDKVSMWKAPYHTSRACMLINQIL